MVIRRKCNGEKNLRFRAVENGVNPERLVFASRVSREEYLNRYLFADLFLDTFPYNAGTIASDALWSGLPVLTRRGASYVSFMAASILSAANLQELITDNRKDYEREAINLAQTPERLASLKMKLIALSEERADPFNTPKTVAQIESAYQKIFSRYRHGLNPESIHL